MQIAPERAHGLRSIRSETGEAGPRPSQGEKMGGEGFSSVVGVPDPMTDEWAKNEQHKNNQDWEVRQPE